MITTLGRRSASFLHPGIKTARRMQKNVIRPRKLQIICSLPFIEKSIPTSLPVKIILSTAFALAVVRSASLQTVFETVSTKR
jgi:hypothetical protein